MKTLARVLAVYLALVLLDGLVLDFKAYQRIVHGGSWVWCMAARGSDEDQYECTNRVFYSRWLWVLISSLMGLAAGYVAMQAVETGRW